jgi:hypothetical protein
MKMKITLITILFCVVAMILDGCALDPDRRLNNAIIQYNEKQPNSLQTLQLEFINNISIDSVKSTDIHSSGTLLYRTQENTAEVIYPAKQSYTLTDGEAVTGIDRTDDYAVITDGLQFCIFDGDGDHLNDETIGDKKNRVKAVLITDDGILYYKNFKLYRYSIIHHSSEQIVKEAFPPPYPNYFLVHLSKHDEFLTVDTGSAGSHNINLINLSTGSVVLKNLGMSSSKHYAGATAIRYITGNSGNWELMQFSIGSKEKKSLAKLTDIVDIELTAPGYILESTTGLWVSEYGKEKRKIPFPYKLAGKYKGRVVLQYRDTSYIIELNKLFAGLSKLMEKTPDLFSGTNK